MADRIPVEDASEVRIVVLDVDGVLTDGGVYMGASEDGVRVELKRFDIADGLGIRMLEWAGIEVLLVSGRESAATTLRAAELGIEAHQQALGYKLGLVEAVLEARDAEWSQVAVMADDLADLPVVRRAGLVAAPANAVAEVKAEADLITERAGGEGAVREFAETLLSARGVWGELVERYCRERERADPRRDAGTGTTPA